MELRLCELSLVMDLCLRFKADGLRAKAPADGGGLNRGLVAADGESSSSSSCWVFM